MTFRPVMRAVLTLAAAAWLPAQAQVLNFEGMPPGLFFDTQSFTQGDYRFTVAGDFGLVDSAAACPVAACPIGSSGQFYFGANDGHLWLTRSDGNAFGLFGFDAAYLAQTPQLAGFDAGRIVLVGRDSQGATVANASLAFGVAGVGGFPFASYGGAALSAFNNVSSIEFFACTYVAGGACVNVNANLSQFALDNVSVQVVPEPPAVALLALGGLGLAAWRRVRRSA